MVNLKIKVTDSAGLHARPAAVLSREAGKFKSDIQLEYGDKKANMKSIMGIMALGITTGKEITIYVEGEDEQAAIDAIAEVIKSNKVGE